MEIATLRDQDNIEGFYLLVSCQSKQTVNSDNYLDIILADKTGEIPAKLWNCNENDIKNFADCKNVIVWAKGVVTTYREQLQLRIEHIRLPDKTENVHISDFVPSAPEYPTDMIAEIKHFIASIVNEEIRVIVEEIVSDRQDDLMKYPAAQKIHHAMYAGLAYHTVSMLRLAEKICELYPSLNRDLLIAGVILHDLCKIEEYTDEFASEYSIEGQLIGHVVMISNLIQETADRLNIKGEIPVLLQHMVLAHHGKTEWGSPVEPKLMEAEVLHHIDMLDSRINAMEKALEKAKDHDQFTEPVRALGRRRLYKPKNL